MKKTILYGLVCTMLSTPVLADDEFDTSPEFGNNKPIVQNQPLNQTQAELNNNRPEPNGNRPVKNFGSNDNVSHVIDPSLNPTMPAYADRELLSRKQVRDQAFKEFVEDNTPFTEDQIREMNGVRDRISKAKQETTMTPAEPYKGDAVVTFDVMTDIPVISVDRKNKTTLIFTDKNNFKWEILSAVIGDNTSFSANEPLSGIQTNMLVLSTTALSGVTNLTVWLKDAPSPLVFTVVSGQPKVDYTFNVKVDHEGPNTPPIVDFGPTNYGKPFNDTDDFKQMKQGVIPKGLRALKITSRSQDRLEAYSSRDGRNIYLRTPMKLISPAYTGGARLLNGDMVYQIPRSEIVTFMHQGRTIDAILSGFPVISSKK